VDDSSLFDGDGGEYLLAQGTSDCFARFQIELVCRAEDCYQCQKESFLVELVTVHSKWDRRVGEGGLNELRNRIQIGEGAIEIDSLEWLLNDWLLD
jgi:hypothetical protein